MGKRRFKGFDPAESARKAAERDAYTRRTPAMWGTNDAALALASNADVHATGETRTKTRRVQRFDCFATLKLSDHSFSAVRRFQSDAAETYGVGDRDTLSEVVDGGSGTRELVTARMMAASKRCDAVLGLMSWADGDLLKALTFPTWIHGQPCNWKATVKRLTGLIDKDAQANCVRAMAENVRAAYAEVDQGVRRAA